MRIKISAVILSLALATTTVLAAPAPIQPSTPDILAAAPSHLSHLQKRNLVTDKLKGLLQKALTSLECSACVAALVGVKDVAYLNKNWVLDVVNDLCPSLAKEPADVCAGLVNSQGPVLINSLLKADLTGGDGKEICFQVLGVCPAPAVSSGTLTFPKPRPANPTIHAPSGVLSDVLHLSDWHVDEQYTPNSEAQCNRPLCCRKYPDSPASGSNNRSASSWGDYNCDSPVKLGQDLLKYVPTVAKPAFAILTGDVPPHDVWAETPSTVVGEEANAYGILASLGATVYPTIGNHESGPPNLFPTTASGGDASWLYNSLATAWSRWLPASATNSVKANNGAYTVSPTPGFRIISLNTNFCYTMNFYLYAKTTDYDPNGELKWLITQLQAAEDAGERVWIIGHVGPSQTDCLQNWSALYYQVVQRYSPHVIAEQFFGHTHYDEFALFYNSPSKNAASAISTAWVGPSVTPYTNLNPGFRVYKVDTGNWNIYDAETYVADLTQASTWDAKGTTPNWHLEYSARAAYTPYLSSPSAATQPLSPAWWHNVTVAFESNPAAFQKYWTYRGKSANKMPACTNGSACPKEMICDLRAGKSSDSCSPISISLKARSDQRAEAMEAMAGEAMMDPSGLRSLYKRAPLKPWNKKLCGTINKH
ncbi:hypothetical protein KI688_006237 [Linnemannia hyalina]|uniref:Sphingomyelin phosphodiesterase n=1 Tax=Linnemannia hyalina TaxID=64524 RepID=A0A9P7Y2Z9_9FUNG|nr:hypothetical protein KI688_006237 [Linnemannia hyalina]